MKNLIITTLIIFTYSCSGKKSNLDFESNKPASQSDGNITFVELQKEIIIPHCIRCHSEFEHESEVKKEIKPGNAEESHFFEHIKDGLMPPDRKPLGTADMEIVRIYIDNLPTGPTGEDNDDHDHP